MGRIVNAPMNFFILLFLFKLPENQKHTDHRPHQ